MSDELPIIFSYGSDVGRVREHNEDAVAAGDSTDPQKKHLGRLFIVADGMGGYLAGEVASELAVETVLQEYYADSSAEPVACLQNALQAANHAVYSSAHSDRSRAGMGTTIVATALVGHKAYIASVGDSRAYVVHDDELVQITQDHSLVGEQIRAGLITKEQARTHPQRNVITRALGSQPVVTADIFEGELSDGDILIMCTDGLTGHVPDERLYGIVTQFPPDQAVERLIELAKQGGGTDNISVIIVRLGQPAPLPAAMVAAASTQTAAQAAKTSTVPAPPLPKRGISPVWIAVGAVLAFMAVATAGVLAIGLGGIWLVRNEHTSTPTVAPTAVLPDTPVAPTVESLPVATAPVTSIPTATMTPTLTPMPLPPTAVPTRLPVLTATATAAPSSPPTPTP
jgi:serine/threonine protein phosphatase PrpC